MPLYRVVKDDEGKESYVPVEQWDAEVLAELPEEAIRQTEPYKSVLSESVQRRKRISEMREEFEARMAALQSDDDADDTPAAKAENQDPPAQGSGHNLDPQALAESVAALVMQRISSQTQAVQEEQSELTALRQEHKLNDEALTVLKNIPRDQRKAVAPTLSALLRRFDADVPGGGEPPVIDFGKIDKKLGIADE